MKNLLLTVMAAFCLFVLFSCGGNECQTCKLEGQDDTTICDDDAGVTEETFDAAIKVLTDAGYTCE